MLDDYDTYRHADKVLAGILIESPENPEGFVNKEIEINVLQDCDTDIKSLAYYTLKQDIQYEFSGSIYKRFFNKEGKVIGRTAILRKNNSWVEVADGFTIYLSDFFENDAILNADQLKNKYNEIERSNKWNLVTDQAKALESKQSFTAGSGYIMVKIVENGDEITKDNPGYIRVRK